MHTPPRETGLAPFSFRSTPHPFPPRSTTSRHHIGGGDEEEEAPCTLALGHALKNANFTLACTLAIVMAVGCLGAQPRARSEPHLLVVGAFAWMCALAGGIHGPGLAHASPAVKLYDGCDVPIMPASQPLAVTLEPPADDDTGGWRWEMPEQQDDLAVGGDGRRICMNCGGQLVVQGVSAAKLGGLWVAFFCKHCAPHLSVRNNAQVPVTWTGPTANITGDLTMLPLYKRCQRCRKWATFGPPGARGVKLHCRSHALESDVPVHRRKCEAPDCKKRPSFAPVGDSIPLRCASHKHSSDMDVSHSRCLHRESKGTTSIRCWRTPTYGYKEAHKGASAKRAGGAGGGVPQMCWEHKSADMVQVFVGTCRHKGCTAAPLYARPAERKLSFCGQHRREGDVCFAEGFCANGDRVEGTSASVAEPFPPYATVSPLPNITLTSPLRHRCASAHWLPVSRIASKRRLPDCLTRRVPVV